MQHLLPSPEIMIGYSGGMALYVANWKSMLYLFELTQTHDLLPKLNINHSLN
jgi:hypothetical protein